MDDYEITNSADRNKGLILRFFDKQELDVFNSNLKQDIIYKNVTYIEKTVPGMSDKVVRPITEKDKLEFAEQYRRFLDNKGDSPRDGFPLESWAPMEDFQEVLAKLLFNRVAVVEQLAELPDDACTNIDPMVRPLKYKAVEFLRSKENKFKALDNEIETLRAENKNLQTQLENAINEIRRPHTTSSNSEGVNVNVSRNSPKNSRRSRGGSTNKSRRVDG